MIHLRKRTYSQQGTKWLNFLLLPNCPLLVGFIVVVYLSIMDQYCKGYIGPYFLPPKLVIIAAMSSL